MLMRARARRVTGRGEVVYGDGITPFHAEFLDDGLMNPGGDESDMRFAILDDYDFSHFMAPSFIDLLVPPQRRPKIGPLTPLRAASVH